MVTFSYDLFEVDKPAFGGIVFPTSVVQNAMASACTPDAFTSQGLMELCRYEHWPGGFDQSVDNDFVHDEMRSKLTSCGRLLEVIGFVQELEIVNGVLRCRGVMQHNLKWHLPLEQHTAVPYMEMTFEHVRPGLKIVKSFAFTEIVLVYQAVTKLALRKFAERKSLLGVDRKA